MLQDSLAEANKLEQEDRVIREPLQKGWKKGAAGSADSARVVRKKRTKGPADLKPQDIGARNSGKARASSSLSHIFSRKMTS